MDVYSDKSVETKAGTELKRPRVVSFTGVISREL